MNKKVMLVTHDHTLRDTIATTRRLPAPILVDLRIDTYSGSFVRAQVRKRRLRLCDLQVGVWTCVSWIKCCHVNKPLHADVWCPQPSSRLWPVRNMQRFTCMTTSVKCYNLCGVVLSCGQLAFASAIYKTTGIIAGHNRVRPYFTSLECSHRHPSVCGETGSHGKICLGLRWW